MKVREASDLFELYPEPAWIDEARSHRLLAVNPAACARYGYDEARFLELTTDDLVAEAERKRVRDTPVRELHRLADGTLLPVERRVHAVRYQDRRARLNAVRDLSDQAALERENRELREDLALHLQNAPAERSQSGHLELLEAALARLNDMVMITEAAPLGAAGPPISYVNEALLRRTGFDREALIGRRPLTLQGPATDRREIARIRDALRTRQPVTAELVIYTRMGQPFRVEAEIVPIADATGAITHFVCVLRDVTEQRELEEKLRRSQRLDAVGQLTGGVAHDFNNLLTVILGNSELLADALAGDARLHTLARMTRTAAERGAELTRRLLAFARRQNLVPDVTDVNELLGGMYGLLCRTLGEHIEIDLRQGNDVWRAMVDAPQLESAVLNLCLNARDAMPGGGRLMLATGNEHLEPGDQRIHEGEIAPGDYVSITVADTGTGMPREIMEHAFEPFFTTKEIGKGSGLGLSMVYGFIKQSAGHVKIHSTLRQGTTVVLYLPRARSPAVEDSLEPPPAELVGGHERILLVEDDDVVRGFVGAELMDLGYTVVSVADGPSAMHELRGDGEFDLLFTDVVMPGGMTGLELAHAAKTLRAGLPVLFTSGYTEDAMVAPRMPEEPPPQEPRRPEQPGALPPGQLLLHKPYRRVELASKVRQALVRRG